MNGDRLRIAREASRLTQAELAGMSGVPASTISKIEMGVYGRQTDRYVTKLAKALDMPESYFSDEFLPDVPEGRYRKQRRASAKLRKSIVANTVLVAEVMREADQMYRIHGVTLRPLEKAEAERPSAEIAAEIRDLLGIGQSGSVKNMTRACERAGVAVVNLPIFGDSGSDSQRAFSGFSVWPGMGIDGSRPIIVLSSSLPGDVQRSTIAHELAHVYAQTRNPAMGHDDAERQAWEIGDAVLVPPEELRESLRGVPVTLDRLRMVKVAYGVSVKLLITYCGRIGIIDPDKVTSLNKQYSSRGWHRQEPSPTARETSLLFPMVLNRMRDDGVDISLIKLARSKIMAEVGQRPLGAPTEATVLRLA